MHHCETTVFLKPIETRKPSTLKRKISNVKDEAITSLAGVNWDVGFTIATKLQLKKEAIGEDTRFRSKKLHIHVHAKTICY